MPLAPRLGSFFLPTVSRAVPAPFLRGEVRFATGAGAGDVAVTDGLATRAPAAIAVKHPATSVAQGRSPGDLLGREVDRRPDRVASQGRSCGTSIMTVPAPVGCAPEGEPRGTASSLISRPEGPPGVIVLGNRVGVGNPLHPRARGGTHAHSTQATGRGAPAADGRRGGRVRRRRPPGPLGVIHVVVSPP